jgi:uncharacterized membrane protein YraQ (UPF0718 family)
LADAEKQPPATPEGDPQLRRPAGKPPTFRRLGAMIDRSLVVFFCLAVASGVACWIILGRDAVISSFASDFAMFLDIVPKLAAALLVASLLQLLVPRSIVAKWIGEGSGAKGVGIATVIGAITPGGPMTSFPMVTALHEAGTGRAPLVAYLTSWSNLGFQRILIWELPLLGLPFVILRYLACLPLPFLAAFLSTRIPMRITRDKPEG